MRSSFRRGRALSLLTGLTLAGLVATALPASGTSKPDFQMPFACGEQWAGSSRATHSPSFWSVDWNRDAYDEGHAVVATAPGVVTSVIDLGDTSYGLYVVIDHGGGWSTLHAHLLRSFVVAGERVDEGQVIALLGTSGGSSGPHLHYEQRFDRTDRRASFDGTPFVYNTWLTSNNCGDRPIVGDWNGNGLSDVGVFARRPASGVVRELVDHRVHRVRFGNANNVPVVGDWDGDGKTNVGIWKSATRRFVLGLDTGTVSFTLGHRGDLPIAGDWNGDGKTDVGVFHPATGTFRLRLAEGVVASQFLGDASSLPIAGDWDGDGRDQVGVYNQATSTFIELLADGTRKKVRFGLPGSLPVVGHWNRDAVSDVGVWDSAHRRFSERFGPRHIKHIPFGHRR